MSPVHDSSFPDEPLRDAALRNSAAILALQGRAEAELRAAKRELEQQRQQLTDVNGLLRATLESTADAILVVDLSGTVVVWNTRFLELWGLTQGEVDGQPFELVARRLAARATGDPEGFASVVREVTTATNAPTVHRLDDGRVLELHASPQRAGAQRVGVVLNWRDITARQRAEADRIRLAEQLRESQKMEALGVLAGGVAHDFNNLLATILGNAELARDARGDALRECLEAVDEAGHRAADLVQQILAFSRKQPRQINPVDVGALLHRTHRMLRAVIPAGVEFGVETPAELPPVAGDWSQLQQVCMNLCTNALQALQRSSGDVTQGRILISADVAEITQSEAGLPHGRYVRIVVNDDGMGIAPQVRDRIFEPFFTTKPFGQGTGLGLSVVHGIVTDHGGAVRVQSSPGEGASFEVLLPPATPAPRVRDAAGEATAAPVVQVPLRIWYVDDEPQLVRYVERCLGRDGHHVDGFTSVLRALDAVGAVEPPDLVITDFNMPHQSGLHLARAVRAWRRDVPVLICSGLVTDDLTRDAEELGATLLYKQEFTKKLRGVVGEYRPLAR